MYRNLNPESLGIAGRQSELIELTLSYGFRGLDVDASDLLKRASLMGVEEATRYLRSGKVKVGGLQLPLPLSADDAAFKTAFEKLPALADIAKQVGFRDCEAVLDPASDTTPYHGNFERHRERLGKVADLLARYEIRLAVGFRAALLHRRGREFQFIHQADEALTLIKTTGCSNLGLALDTWNWRLGGGDWEAFAGPKAPPVFTLRIADVPMDVDLNAVTDEQRLPPSDETVPGHAALLGQLVDRNYDGPVTIACHASQLPQASRDACVSKCAAWLDKIWNAAGLTKAGKRIAPAPA
jgi:sugar phosphate isomerase/epimerase